MLHYSDISIAAKVAKLSSYSTLVADERAARGRKCRPLTLVFYPPFVFLRTFVMKRNYLNGWAGFIGSVCMAFYAFMKYAKIYEHNQSERAADQPQSLRFSPHPVSPSSDDVSSQAA